MKVDNENRSELLRRQRLLQGDKKVKRITRHAVTQLNDDTPRTPKSLLSLFKKKEPVNQPFERSFPISANEPQQKTEEKEKKKIHLSWRILSGIFVILFSACILVAWRSPDFQVGVVEIIGLERISQDDVNRSFDILQKPIIAIQPDEIITKIRNAFPEFKDIKVNVALPNKVTVNLSERMPVLAWKVGETTILIDSDGIVFPARGQVRDLLTIESYSLPIFSYPKDENEIENLMIKSQPKHNYWKLPPYSMIWFEYHQLIDPGLFKAVVRLNAQIPSEKVFLYDPHRGLGWNDPRGWKIYVGFDLERINEKWLAYERIVSEFTNQGIHPTLVSVEYLNAPYYRLD